jgi:hypothetical protein
MNRKDLVKKFSKATAIGLCTVAGAYFTADVIGYTYGTEEQTCFTVVDKSHIPNNISAKDAQGKYFISTEQGEVFENADSFWRFKSSDDTQQLQNQLQEGQSYQATVYGWQNGAFNDKRNIVELELTNKCNPYEL